MRYEILTKKKILELSAGRVSKHDEDIRKDDKIVFDPYGPYSENIFGASGHTSKVVSKANRNPEINPRFNLYGHIDLNVPVMIPGTRMKQILGCEPKPLNKLINGDSAVLILKKERRRNEKRDEVNSMIIGLKKIKAIQYIKTTIPPKRSKEDRIWKEVAYCNGAGYMTIDLDTISKYELKQYFYILPATYGLAFILAHLDVAYEMNLIKEFNKINTTGSEADSLQWLKENVDNQRKKVKGYSSNFNAKLPYLRGMAIQKMQPHEYITDVIPVIPAGFRDPVITMLKGVKTITVRYINEYYNRIIKEANANPPLFKGQSIDLDSTVEAAKGPTHNYHIFENPQYTKSDTIKKYKNINEALHEMTVRNKGGKDKVSIPEVIGTKKGRFRDKDLGKRLDSSMRGVITPDINLEFDQVGIPIKLLGTYFSEANDIDKGVIKSIDGEEGISFVDPDRKSYDARRSLQANLDLIRSLVIRFPSLHRFNEMGAKIVPITGDSIKIPPLRCSPYNADFDGDTMTVVLLRHKGSIEEVDRVMLPSKNLLDTNGNALMTPSQDMVLGLYYATMNAENSRDIETVFNSMEELKRAYKLGEVRLRDRVKVMLPPYDVRYESYKRKHHALEVGNKGYKTEEPVLNENPDSSDNFNYMEDSFEIKLSKKSEVAKVLEVPAWEDVAVEEVQEVKSTVGRFLINEFIPQDLGNVDRNVDRFSLELDTEFSNSVITSALTTAIKKYSQDAIILSQELMKAGFSYATVAAMSLSILDIYPSPAIAEVLGKRGTEIKLAEQSTNKDKKIQTWASVTKEIEDTAVSKLNWDNPLAIMVKSKARGSKNQVMQLTGMKGLIAKSDGTIVEHVVSQSLIEGLSPINYFQASFGGRKGMVDRSLTTSKTGDIERHLIYGLSDILVVRGDCGDHEGLIIKDRVFNPKVPLSVPLTRVIDEETDEIIIPLTLVNKEVITVKDLNGNKYEAIALSAVDAMNELRFNKVINIDGQSVNDKVDYNIEEIYKKAKSYITIIRPDSLREEVILLRETGGKVLTKDKVLAGRELACETVVDGKVFPRNYKIKEEDIPLLIKVKELRVRSVITCKEAHKGKICARCYGEFPVEQRYAAVGDAVGVISAQTLGERTTQLTMRTFHTGGVASGDDVTQGLPEFEKFIKSSKKYEALSKGDRISSGEDQDVDLSDLINNTNESRQMFTAFLMNRFRQLKDTGKSDAEIIDEIMVGDLVLNGEPITWEHIGIIDTDNRQEALDSVYSFIEGVYAASDVYLNRVHYEIAVKSMLSFSYVVYPGDSKYAVGEVIPNTEVLASNIKLILQGKDPMMAVTQVSSMKELGVKDPGTAMTFQYITRNMENCTSMAKEDALMSPLSALASNKRLPVGQNGFKTIRDRVTKMPDILTFDEILDSTTPKLVFGDNNFEKKIKEELKVNETEKLVFGEPPIEVTRVETTYDEEIIEWEDLSEDEPFNELSKMLEDLDESDEVKGDISDILEF